MTTDASLPTAEQACLDRCDPDSGMGEVTVLIVGDTIATGNLLALQVDSLGYAVMSARDGNAALAMLTGRRADIALTDLDMPDPNGYKLLELLRRRYPGLPVVAVGTSDQDSDVERNLALGFFDYVSKPGTRERLAHVLNRLLMQRTASTAGRDGSQPTRDDELWPAFIQYAVGDLDALTRVLAARDLPALKQWMHRMRGALLVLKCKSIAAGFHDIEKRCEQDHEWNQNLSGDTQALASELRALIAPYSAH